MTNSYPGIGVHSPAMKHHRTVLSLLVAAMMMLGLLAVSLFVGTPVAGAGGAGRITT
jgi:hypothetical protein